MPSVLDPVNRLAGATPERVREVDVVSTAYSSVLSRHFTYVSTPITSGRRLYEAVRRSGLPLPEFLASKQAMKEEVIRPNVEHANEVAHRLMDRFNAPTIAPSVFEARALGWGQDDYMALWFKVINEKVTLTAMLDGWEYSNGACEEATESFLMQAGFRGRTTIVVKREDGTALKAAEVFHRLVAAMYDLQQYGALAPRVAFECAVKMRAAEEALAGLEGRAGLYDRADSSALRSFIYERGDLLNQLDPAFINQTSLMAERAREYRATQAPDAHLTRRREEFEGADVGLHGIERADDPSDDADPTEGDA